MMLMTRHHRALLIRLQVGGCTCMTKTNEVKYHASDCQYRLASEIEDALKFVDDTPELLSASKPATQVVTPVCPRPCRYAYSFDYKTIAASPQATIPKARGDHAIWLLEALIDIYDDEQTNAPEDRSYAEGAWMATLADIRAFLGDRPAQTRSTDEASKYARYLAESACDNGDSWESVKPMLDVILASIGEQPAQTRALTDEQRETIREAAQCLAYAVTLTQDGYDGETGPASEWYAAAQRLSGELSSILATDASGDLNAEG